MNKTLTLTFDKSQNDIPVLVVSKKSTSFLSSEVNITVERVITGDEALLVWNLITGEKAREEQ